MFLPYESQGQGSLVGCCLWGHTERLSSSSSSSRLVIAFLPRSKCLLLSRQSRKIRRFNLLCDDTPPKDEAILCTGEELSSPVYLLSLLPQRLSYHWAPLRLTAPCPAFYTSALTLKEDRRKAVPLVYILRSEQNGHSTA